MSLKIMPDSIGSSAIAKEPKRLAVFDFDQTICDDNTDTKVRALLDRKLITPEIQKLVENEGWTRYMQEIFVLLHKNGRTELDIRRAIQKIPEVPGMVKLLKTLKKLNFDLVIISDSNSVFISEWLIQHGIPLIFTEIYTNPAKFDENALLKLTPYHHQTDCKLSAENLCKGKVLNDFIRKKLQANCVYESVFYAGDGSNDICPVLRLTSKDFGCPRFGFSMDKKINNSNLGLRCKMIRWSSGFELLGEILEKIGRTDKK